MNIIPEGYKVIDYKNIRKNCYYINKEGKVLNKKCKTLSINSGRIHVQSNDNRNTSYSVDRILNKCFEIPLPKKKSDKKVYKKHYPEIPEGYKVIDYKNIKKDFYYINEKDGKVISKYSTEMNVIHGRVSLMISNKAHTTRNVSISTLYKYVFGVCQHVRGYKLINRPDIKQNMYYYKKEDDKYIIKNVLGNTLKINDNNTVRMYCKDGSKTKVFTLDYIFEINTFKQNGYIPIKYKDIKKGFYYINKEGKIINKFHRPVVIQDGNRINLQREKGITGMFDANILKIITFNI